MHLNLLNAFLLFGIFQGVILVVVFMKKKGQPPIVHRLVSGIILALTLATLGTFLGSAFQVNKEIGRMLKKPNFGAWL